MATEGEKIPTTSIDGYPIDVTTSEDHTFDAVVTDYPVEKGSDKSDHIQNKQPVVTMEGVVTDTPLAAMILERLAAGDKVPGAQRGTLPSVDALAKLLEVREARQPVTITTSLKTFENMALTQLQLPRMSGEGRALRFSATFRQMDIVENERTTIKVKTAIPTGKTSFGPRIKPAPSFEKAYAGARSRPVFTIIYQHTTRNPVTGAIIKTEANIPLLRQRYGMNDYVTKRLADGIEQLHWNADSTNSKLPKADGYIVDNPGNEQRHVIGNGNVTNADGSVGPSLETSTGAQIFGVTRRTSVAYSGTKNYFYQAFTEVVSAGVDPETGDEKTIVRDTTSAVDSSSTGAHFDKQKGTWVDKNGTPLSMMNRQGKPATPADVASGNIWGRGPSSETVQDPFTGRQVKPGGF